MTSPNHFAAEAWHLYRIGEMARGLLNINSAHPVYQGVRLKYSADNPASTQARRELMDLTRSISRWAMDWHKDPDGHPYPPDIETEKFIQRIDQLSRSIKSSESEPSKNAVLALREEAVAIQRIRETSTLNAEQLDSARAFALIEEKPKGRPDNLRHSLTLDGTAIPTQSVLDQYPRLRTEADRLMKAAGSAAEATVESLPMVSNAASALTRAAARLGIATGIGVAGAAFTMAHIGEAQAKGHTDEAVTSAIGLAGPLGFVGEQARRLANDTGKAIDAASLLATGGRYSPGLGSNSMDPSLPIAAAQIPVAAAIDGYNYITGGKTTPPPTLSTMDGFAAADVATAPDGPSPLPPTQKTAEGRMQGGRV